MKTIIGLVVLAGVVGGLFMLNEYTRTKDGTSLLHVAPEVEILVETATPEQRTIVRRVQAPGEVEPLDEVDISSEVMGKIVEMPVEEGDYVRAGELLCRLDDTEYRARVLSAEANVAKLKALIVQADAELEKAERDWDQQQQLRETHATSEMELSNYRTALVRARATVEMRGQELKEAEAFLESAREDLEKTVMRAPISGVIAQLFAEQGEVVITGTMNNPGTRVMVISDLSQMQVRCRIDEADAPLVKAEQPARIYLQSDTRRSIPGTVLRVGTKGTKPLGRDVVTFETLVLITGQDERVKPGMTANVEVEVARRDDALTIPIEAVVHRKRRDLPEEFVRRYDAQREQEETEDAFEQHLAEYIPVVFAIADGKAVPRLVEIGISDPTRVEIREGIVVDDVLVTGPYRSLDQLKSGSAVKLEEPEVEAAGDEAVAADGEQEEADGQAGGDEQVDGEAEGADATASTVGAQS